MLEDVFAISEEDMIRSPANIKVPRLKHTTAQFCIDDAELESKGGKMEAITKTTCMICESTNARNVW